ncbi:acyltransferase family protein [Catellatospora sp. KI3]|uniref:acyltransferase family protein n=1 Tax=Catellatospora sp. KI3 TaxID=3041620 RepID=UPI0024831B28|nr:acyltransferase family protein [Catellatospora sp. KI3]MDI1464328.1 acyltransferase family protein [Catellatospora sp. KI3]
MTELDKGSAPRAGHGYRGDIEGMRAVAVGLVLLAHAGVPWVAGGFVGVDVFFVISGFLITGLLVAEQDRNGRISLTAFYARRAKRLLPAAAVVLVSTLVLAYAFLPATRWRGTVFDVVASACYAMNWRLAAQAVDYLAADDAPSMLQHFWSLAVEEQFYLVWPLLLIAAAVLARRAGIHRRSPLRRYYLTGLSLIGVPSLAYSIYLTAADPARAYFVTPTRLWELALGAALAITARSSAKLPARVAAAMAWCGLALVLVSAVMITPATTFPGYAALLPTIGTGAVLAGGLAAGRSGPVRVLGLRPVRAIGAISYSLYLWHWPLLMAAESYYGKLSTGAGLAVVLASVVPAVLTYRLVENPVRLSPRLAARPGRALALGLACTLLPVAGAFGFQAAVLPTFRPVPNAAGAQALVASVTSGMAVDRVDAVTPDPVTARDDLPLVYGQNCVSLSTDSKPKACVYGSQTATFTVALVGDSHAAQWFPALKTIAEQRQWRLVTYLKASCPLLNETVTLSGRAFDACAKWNTAVREVLAGPDKPDLAVVSASTGHIIFRDGAMLGAAENKQAIEQAMRSTLTAVTGGGVPVVLIRDTPRPLIDIPECVARHWTELTRCGFSQSRAAETSEPQVRAAQGAPGVHLIDVNQAICPSDPCAPIIGDVLVYRDTHHLTATYASTLVPLLGVELDRVVADLPHPVTSAP